MDLPRVSCIMPTADRRRFAERAVAYFLRQDYPQRELLVLDQGASPVDDLLPADQRVRYIRLPRGTPMYQVRNLACEAARGELILHWDDDDWMASWRVSYQVAGLLRSGADLCGISRMYYLDVRSCTGWEYIYPAGRRPFVCDNTLCYAKAFWQRHPFPPAPRHVELAFQWSDTPKQVMALEDHRFYVGIIHGANAAPKNTREPRWHPRPIEQLRALLGDDWEAVSRLDAMC